MLARGARPNARHQLDWARFDHEVRRDDRKHRAQIAHRAARARAADRFNRRADELENAPPPGWEEELAAGLMKLGLPAILGAVVAADRLQKLTFAQATAALGVSAWMVIVVGQETLKRQRCQEISNLRDRAEKSRLRLPGF
jgi:hypothetical protein